MYITRQYFEVGETPLYCNKKLKTAMKKSDPRRKERTVNLISNKPSNRSRCSYTSSAITISHRQKLPQTCCNLHLEEPQHGIRKELHLFLYKAEDDETDDAELVKGIVSVK